MIPYRTPPFTNARCKDSVERIKGALGIRREPLLDGMHDRESLLQNASQFCSKIADIVTVWYAPFLIQEIRQALSYEEALPAASLLAFSEKTECIESLARLLRSNRPLDVLVTIEILGDVVVFESNEKVRRLALSYLIRCDIELAKVELRDAIDVLRQAA